MSAPGPGPSHESSAASGWTWPDPPDAAGRRALAGSFLHRVFTQAEIDYCQRRHDPIPHLAARFAAKEAAMKALGTGLRMGVTWREVEVRRERGEAPTIVLTGRTAAIARAKGTSRILVSLTHDGDYAFAQVILVGDVRNGHGELG